MGRFLTGEGIGRIEKHIRSSVPALPPAAVGERNGNRKKPPSVVVEVGSVCSLDANRIVRDFGEK